MDKYPKGLGKTTKLISLVTYSDLKSVSYHYYFIKENHFKTIYPEYSLKCAFNQFQTSIFFLDLFPSLLTNIFCSISTEKKYFQIRIRKHPNYAFHVLTAGRIQHSKIQCLFRKNLLGQRKSC